MSHPVQFDDDFIEELNERQPYGYQESVGGRHEGAHGSQISCNNFHLTAPPSNDDYTNYSVFAEDPPVFCEDDTSPLTAMADQEAIYLGGQSHPGAPPLGSGTLSNNVPSGSQDQKADSLFTFTIHPETITESATRPEPITDGNSDSHYFEERPGPELTEISMNQLSMIKKAAIDSVIRDAIIAPGIENHLFGTPAAALGVALNKTIIPHDILRDVKLHVKTGAYRTLFKLVDKMMEIKVMADRNNYQKAYEGKSNSPDRPYGYLLKNSDGSPTTKARIRTAVNDLLDLDAFLGSGMEYLQHNSLFTLLSRVFYGSKTGYCKAYKDAVKDSCPERGVLAVYEVLLNRKTGDYVNASTQVDVLSAFYDKIAAELAQRKLDPDFDTSWGKFLRSIPIKHFVG
ncbi:hypothetical protein BV22DRAFT_1135271 [Leucogyrophana mollusca]|uniref:Uncharacterized protein n=1 Tax=Leucogyrophana mollusca TaxID=85980 RepID=A0ACB8AWN9_9AGAM|nr:hypothetical protein BV22DRAFT_1135271 [Leucogyrophana mollusca]